ncbi:MAG: KOW domain-containing RNA-binding protein [Clostridia bacterium]
MIIEKTHIISSLAGRDKGRLFIVMETEPDFVYLADGRLRKLESMKKKRLKHVAFVSPLGERLAAKIRNGEKVLNSEIRRALSEYSAEADAGNDAVSSTGR